MGKVSRLRYEARVGVIKPVGAAFRGLIRVKVPRREGGC